MGEIIDGGPTRVHPHLFSSRGKKNLFLFLCLCIVQEEPFLFHFALSLPWDGGKSTITRRPDVEAAFTGENISTGLSCPIGVAVVNVASGVVATISSSLANIGVVHVFWAKGSNRGRGGGFYCAY